MKKVGPVNERDALLIAARRRGLTMPEIGAEFGITTNGYSKSSVVTARAARGWSVAG